MIIKVTNDEYVDRSFSGSAWAVLKKTKADIDVEERIQKAVESAIKAYALEHNCNQVAPAKSGKGTLWAWLTSSINKRELPR